MPDFDPDAFDFAPVGADYEPSPAPTPVPTAREPTTTSSSFDPDEFSFGPIEEAPPPTTAPAAVPQERPGFFSSLNTGVWEGAASNPDALADFADYIEAGEDDPDPNSLTKRLGTAARSAADALRNKDTKAAQAFLDIRDWDDLKEWSGHAIGQAAGSTVLPLLAAAVGGGIGFVTPVPGATAVGAALGGAAVNVPIGIGSVWRGLNEDPEIKKKIEDGELSVKGLKPYATVGGAIVGALDTAALSKFLSITGLTKEAATEAVKMSLRKAILTGAGSEGLTETLQQIVQDVSTNLAGGNVELKQMAVNALESGTAGALGGGALGGAGKVITPGRSENSDKKTDPNAGASTPGGNADAPPPAKPVVDTPSSTGKPTVSDAPVKEEDAAAIKGDPVERAPSVEAEPLEQVAPTGGEERPSLSTGTPAGTTDITTESAEEIEESGIDPAVFDMPEVREKMVEAGGIGAAPYGAAEVAALKNKAETPEAGVNPKPPSPPPPPPPSPDVAAEPVLPAAEPVVPGPAPQGARLTELPDPTEAIAEIARREEPVITSSDNHVEASYDLPEGKGGVSAQKLADRWELSSGLDDALRGRGLGVRAYMSVIGNLFTRGVPVVTSDIVVSPDAAKVYDNLEKRGFHVVRNPSVVREDGQIMSTERGKPVFEVHQTPPQTQEAPVAESGIVAEPAPVPVTVEPAAEPTSLVLGEEPAAASVAPTGEPAATPAQPAPPTNAGEAKAVSVSRLLTDAAELAHKRDPGVSVQDYREAIQRVVGSVQSYIREHPGSVSQIMRELEPHVVAATPAAIEHVQRERAETEGKRTEEQHEKSRAAREKSKAKERAEAKPQQQARTTKEGKKAATDIEEEKTGKPFLARAQKAVKEQGEKAPEYYREAVETEGKRKAIGTGKGRPKAEVTAERAALSEQQEKARQREAHAQAKEEFERRVREHPATALVEQADAPSVEKFLRKPKGEATEEMISWLRKFVKGARSALPERKSKKKKGEDQKKLDEIPDQMSKDNPPALNFLVGAKRLLERKAPHSDMMDFLTSWSLFKQGHYEEALQFMATDEDAFHVSYGEETHADTIPDDIDMWQGHEGYDADDLNLRRGVDPELGYVEVSTEDAEALALGAVELNDQGRTYQVAKKDVHKLGDLLSEADAATPSYVGAKLGKYSAIAQALRRQMVKQIKKLIPNMPTYIMDNAQVREFMDEESRDRGDPTPAAIYIGPSLKERAKGSKAFIVINRDVYDKRNEAGGKQDYFHAVLHEGVHGVFQMAIDQNWNGVGEIMQMLYKNAKQQATWKGLYGYTNTQEFAAEAMSDRLFQEELYDTHLPSHIVAKVRALQAGRTKVTWWDALAAVASNAMHMVGLGRAGMNALQAVMAVAPSGMMSENVQAFRSVADVRAGKGKWLREGSRTSTATFDSLFLTKTVQNAADAARLKVDAPGFFGRMKTARERYLQSTMGLARKSREVFGGENNPLERTLREHLKHETLARELMEEGYAVNEKLAKWIKRHHREAEELSDIGHDATLAGVDPSLTFAESIARKHFSKKGTTDLHKRETHAALHRRWQALSQDAKQLLKEQVGFYTKSQHDAVLRATTNMVEDAWAKGGLPSALASAGTGQTETVQTIVDWVISGDINRVQGSSINPQNARDEALHKAIGNVGVIKALKDAGNMRRVKGMYLPLMRDGEFVTSAEMPVDVPQGAVAASSQPQVLPNRKKIGNLLIFKDKAAVEQYQKDAVANGIQIDGVVSVWVDPQTGQRTQKVEPNSEQRFVVTVQNKLVEFFDTLTEAQAREQELRKGPYANVTQALQRQEFLSTHQTELLPSTINRLKKSASEYQQDKNLSDFVENAISMGALRMMSGTRIGHRKIKRRGIQGFSRDMVKAGLAYNTAHAHFMAGLTGGRDKWRSFQEAQEYLENQRYTGDNLQDVRQRLIAETHDRLTDVPSSHGSRGEDLVNLVTSWSFITHLMSPAYSMINAMQVGMVTMPYLGARYGYTRTLVELGKAYKQMGTARILAQGLGQTFKQGVRLFKPAGKSPNFFADIQARFAGRKQGAQINAAMEEVKAHGLFDAMAGLEAELQEFGKGGLTKFVMRVARVARAMPEAIEAINRTATVVATVRAHMARNPNATQEQINTAVLDAVESTQGGYGRANSPNIMNSKGGRIAFQFKKYGMMMGNLLGKSTVQSINAKTPQERKIARKTLLGLSLTHFAMAGLVGLPFLEFAKGFAMALGAMGLGSGDWDEYETEMQAWLSKLLDSEDAGEMFMRGPLSRLLGMDLSNRMGADSLYTFGAPRSLSKDAVQSWLFETAAGPVYGMLRSVFQAASAGDITKLPLPKMITDTLKAYNNMGGKTDSKGVESPPLSAYETAMQAAGIRPASLARPYEKGEGAEKKAASKLRKETRDLRDEYLKIPRSDFDKRQKFFQEEIQPWNEGKTYKEKITRGELIKLEQRREREKKKKEREKRREAA